MLVGDYYIPNISMPKARRTGNIGKYGRLKLNYMKKYKIAEYTEMLLNNELKSYLLDIDDECNSKIENLVKELAKRENVTEELKANMLNEIDTNNYKNIFENIKQEILKSQYQAMQAINKELIFMYWHIGKIILENSQWGNKFVDNLSIDLKLEFPEIRRIFC